MAWLARLLHFVGAVGWIGGYVMLVFALMPLLESAPERLQAAALKAIRVISLCGALTIFSGLLLVAYSRGYAAFGHGEWGGLIASALVCAVALMGVSDAALRPAVRTLTPANPAGIQKAKRWAVVSLALGVLILAIMARLPYAPL